MNIVFRVDASIEIGTGHVMRCLALANGLTEGGATVRFIVRAQKGDLIETIRAKGYSVASLRNSSKVAIQPVGSSRPDHPSHSMWLKVPWEQDAEETADALGGAPKPDWLIVDHYSLDAKWERVLSNHCHSLMVIDDLADRAHACDLLLDQNIGRAPSDYVGLVPANCSVLTSPTYALLRPEFAAMRRYSLNRRSNPKSDRILVALGGVDRDNVTCDILNSLKECDLSPTTEIKVVMGAAAPWLAEVRAVAEQMPRRTEIVINTNDMAKLMAESDLAIGAAGGSSWERCTLGLPTILVTLAENQLEVADALAMHGAAILLRDRKVTASTIATVEAALSNPDTLASLSEISAKLCDGRGVARAVSEMKAVWERGRADKACQFLLRTARADDSFDLWKWRNDPETRLNSLDTNFVPWATHVKWFEKVGANPNRVILIGEVSGVKCGMVRFDRRLEHGFIWEVSIALDPASRGLGLGSLLLDRGCTELLRRCGQSASLLANVRCTNIRSRRMFEKSGFVLEGQTDNVVQLRKKMHSVNS